MKLAIALALLLSAPPFEQIQTGNGKDGFHLVIAPDGFTAADIAAEADDPEKKIKAWKPLVKKAVDELFTIEPYKHYRHTFSILRLDTPSDTHGLPMPHAPSQFTEEAARKYNDLMEAEKKKFKEDRKPTHYGLSWPDDGAPAPEDKAFETLKSDLDGKPCDMVVFMVPDEEINNGKANHDHSPAWVVMNTLDIPAKGDFKGTVAHEMGHAFFRLGDEYGGTNCLGDKPTFRPNTTDERDPKKLKWRHLTDDRTEGAHGCDLYFHPKSLCRMNRKWPYHETFCNVCLEAMTHRISERYRIIESTEPDATVMPKYIAPDSMSFKVKMRGTDASKYYMRWTFDGRDLGEGTVTKGPGGPTSEFTLKKPPLSFGVHILRFLVEDINNLHIKDKTDVNGKAPQTKTWVLTIAPSNPILPIPGVDFSW